MGTKRNLPRNEEISWLRDWLETTKEGASFMRWVKDTPRDYHKEIAEEKAAKQEPKSESEDSVVSER